MKPTLKPTSANALTQEAIRVLTLKGYVVWRCQTVGVWDVTKRVFRRNSATKGVSDIIGFKKGEGARFVAIEVKVGKDKLSPEQVTFLESVEKAGGIALVIRNSDDLVKI